MEQRNIAFGGRGSKPDEKHTYSKMPPSPLGNCRNRSSDLENISFRHRDPFKSSAEGRIAKTRFYMKMSTDEQSNVVQLIPKLTRQ
jgi:hypothetical protein